MKQFFKYVLATVVGLILFGALSVFLCLSSLVGLVAMSETETIVSPHSVYVLDMNGSVSERSVDDPYEAAIVEAMGGEASTEYGLNDILANIKKAKTDPNIDGIYLSGGSLSMGPATSEAIRRALVDFRESGKWVIAYADNYGQTSYYLASCADRVMLNADGSLDWHGMGITLEFYTRLLNKLGIDMQIVKVGTFKSAVEPFILTEMSEPNRMQYTLLADDIWSNRLQAVASSRRVSTEQLNRLADLYMAYQPQEMLVSGGLVDTLCYVQDVDTLLAQLCGTDDYTLLSHSEYLSAPAASSAKAKDKIAVLYAEGDITESSGDGIVGEDVVETISEILKEDDVRAVVLRVNSGGGSAYASEQIHHALTLIREAGLPLVVSMGDYAASGGYYISCPADYIFAEETTLTGSIGIFGMIPSVGKLTDKVGIDFDGVQTNRHANLENNMVLKGMTAEERALLQAEINRGYELFTRRCAEGRGVSQDSIKRIGEGRVWSGTRALEIGLVDAIGGIDCAVAKAAEMTQLTEYQLVDYPEEEDVLTKLLNAMTGEARIDAAIQKRLGSRYYRLYREVEKLSAAPSIQARIPYIIDIH